MKNSGSTHETEKTVRDEPKGKNSTVVPPADVPLADVLIVTATKVESKAVLDAFAELTGQPARPMSVGRRAPGVRARRVVEVRQEA